MIIDTDAVTALSLQPLLEQEALLEYVSLFRSLDLSETDFSFFASLLELGLLFKKQMLSANLKTSRVLR